jgi:hypothetical protein
MLLEALLNVWPEAACHAHPVPVIMPGAPEPEWLHRNAEHRRVLRALKAERRAIKSGENARRAGFIDRLKLVLSRG